MDEIVRKLPAKGTGGAIDLIEVYGIFYLEAQGDDTLIRTKRKKPYKSVQRIGELAKKLPAPAFARCHREYIVNLNRVRSITPRNSRDFDLRLEPSSHRQLRRVKSAGQPSHPHRPRPFGEDSQNTWRVEIKSGVGAK